MNKKVISITFFVFIICSGFLFYLLFFSTNNKTINKKKNDIDKINVKINKVKDEISVKEEEKNNFRDNNIEKVELLEVWEKELEKVKRNS